MNKFYKNNNNNLKIRTKQNTQNHWIRAQF